MMYMKEHIDFGDIDEEEYGGIDKYINKKRSRINYCIRVSEQDLDRFIDELEKRGYKWLSGESVRSKHIYFMQERGTKKKGYYIALFIDDKGRKRIINVDMFDKIIIDFNDIHKRI